MSLLERRAFFALGLTLITMFLFVYTQSKGGYSSDFHLTFMPAFALTTGIIFTGLLLGGIVAICTDTDLPFAEKASHHAVVAIITLQTLISVFLLLLLSYRNLTGI